MKPIIGSTESERLIGTRRREKIFGLDGDDTLEGRQGFDHLFGGDGNDVLIGGQGRDRFNGGRGNDTLTGNVSKDFFIFDAREEIDFKALGVDTITDFVPDQDTIILAKRKFTEISSDAGNGFSIDNEFDTVTDNATTSDAIIVYDSTTGQLFYNANGSEEGFGNGGQFAVLKDIPDLKAEDFRLRANPAAEPEAKPEVSINKVRVVEGDVGTTDVTFTVNLNAPSEQTIEVGYDTDPSGIVKLAVLIPDEAIAGQDYEVTRGLLTFNPGETTKTFTVPIIGDTEPELDDFFTVYLLEPTTMNTDSPNILATTKGIIENDDAEITNNVIKFTPSSTEEEITAQNGPSIELVDGQTIYIGTWQRTGNNQDPIIASFDPINPTNNWVRTDYETTGADGRGRGLFWDGDNLYAVFSIDGTQGTPDQDFRRATTEAVQPWLRSYGQGGGASVSVVARIDIDDLTNPGEMTDAAYLTALLSNGNSNTLKVTDLSINSDNNLIVEADSFFSPRNPDGSRIEIPSGLSSPFDYRLVITPDLDEVLESEVIF
ncbi:MAG: hypothetical protein MGF17_10220 [Trichodesmium sp. MAG_R04]|nr:hypothetical protein [Trichodesmium sp. MAG_R04]